MAAPQLSEAIVRDQTKIRLVFDQALDGTIAVPVTCFQINYGKIPIVDRKYVDTNELELILGRNLTPGDKVFLNYTPPEDVNLALRAPIKANASVATIRRNVVRAPQRYEEAGIKVSVNFQTVEGHLVYIVKDRESGDVIRQIPSEEALRISKHLDRLTGIMLDKSVE